MSPIQELEGRILGGEGQPMTRLLSKPPVERMAYIAKLLRNGTPFKLGQVAQHFEVAYKTIHRDVDFMRDRLGYEMIWVQTGHRSEGFWIGKLPEERIL